MRISVEDFKGIIKIDDFRLEQISVLSGANSGGKSTLVQLIMLLKQSLEARSPDAPLKLNKPYVSLGRFENLLRRNSGKKSFKVAITLEQGDWDSRLTDLLYGRRRLLGLASQQLFQHLDEVKVTAEFKKTTNGIAVSNFGITLSGDKTATLSINRNSHGKSYQIDTDVEAIFFRRLQYSTNSSSYTSPTATSEQPSSHNAHIGHIAFFPDEFNLIDNNDLSIVSSQILNQIRNSVFAAFSRIAYIGPLREEPREFYYHDDDLIDQIGNKGENAAFLLSKHADDVVEYRRFESTPDDGKIVNKSGELREAVNYWLCDVFDLAKEVKVERAKTNRYIHSVTLKNGNGEIIPITHVGFGVSQIFPILVEGLRTKKERRLIILEQPEIHLHPKVQSLLFDFIRMTPNTSFLIETHSDHFINRLRRRVAEDKSQILGKNINLTFVNSAPDGAFYEHLELTQSGSLARWPIGFFDQHDNDIRAIVKAQAEQRKIQKG